MIQRVQTIYLLLSVIVTGLLFIFPVWAHNPPLDNIGASSHIYLLPIWGIMLLIQIIAIFLFKNRKRQMRLGQLAIVLNAVFLILALVVINMESSSDFSIQDFKIGAIFPLISIILLIMANRNIRKDEELVRSMNRLR